MTNEEKQQPTGISSRVFAFWYDFRATETPSLYQIDDLVKAELDQQKHSLIERIKGMRKRSGTRTNFVCPKCGYFGGKDTFCIYDRRKLVEKNESWEETSDEYYNQALDDLLAALTEEEE